MADRRYASRPFPERQWRPVPDYEGLYEVSSRGDVWSLPRPAKRGRKRGLLLRQHLDRKGLYLNVALCRDGKQKTVQVHLLVMRAFADPCPPGQKTRHLDGNSMNNSWPDNLVYGTQPENERDKIGHGTAPRGERNGRHKLTAEDIREIHRRYRLGEPKRSLSRSFGVAPPMIRRILSGSAWQDVAREFPRTAETAVA
ncbi:MAG TPA: NUMOD4 domain-containing protein [Streptosporangiaceae bacterium]|nr:NUMOD4 domain-containing protein [Streptosporangiaceae bacterium]